MLFLLVGYLLVRLINLSSLPIFNDEAIYLEWGWRSLHLPNNLFYPLYDAKAPLMIWLFGIVHPLFSDPLIAGRLVSVCFGLLAAIGLYFVTKKLFNRRTATIAVISYIFIPIFVFFDRQALMESALGAVNIWSLYFFLKILEIKKIKAGIFLGIVLGLGFLIKYSAGIYFLLVIILGLITTAKLKKQRTVLLMSLMSAGFISQWLLAPLYLQPQFWTSFNTNNRYTYSLSQILSGQLAQWGINTVNLFTVSLWHLTPLILIAGVVGVWLSFKKLKNKKLNLMTVFWLILSLLLLIIISKNISPRYSVSFLVPIVIYSSYLINLLISRKAKINYLIILVIFSLPILITATLIFKPLTYFNIMNQVTKFSQQEEYVTSWTSGYGLSQAISFIKDQSQNQLVIAAVRVDAGIPESAVLAYFEGSKRIRPIFLDERIIQDNLNHYNCLQLGHPLYFVSRDEQLAGLGRFFTEVKRFYKPIGANFIGLYKLKENCSGSSLVLKLPQ